MKQIFPSYKGFTLIEIIASILIVSFIGIIVSMGMVQAISGYIHAKQNTETLQNGQTTIARLVKELNAATSISSPTSNSLQFNSMFVWKDVNTLKLNSGSGDDILTDNVKDFKILYYDTFNFQGTIPQPHPLTLPIAIASSVKIIDIELTLTGANNSDAVFKDRVFLRNLVN